MTGTFIISLDFELLWGIWGCGAALESNIVKEIDADIVPRLLALFKKYDIHATWATVGALMAKDEADFRRFLSGTVSEQTQNALAALGFSDSERLPPEQRRLLFAPDWVNAIRNAQGQELASHTYTHFYCDLPESTPEQLSVELASSKAIALENGIELNTLVFPRNQVKPEFVKAAQAQGFGIYRGKEINADTGMLIWYLNHYLPLRKCSYVPSEIEDGKCLNIKASRFYKPYRKKYALLEPLKMRHYQRELLQAAKDGEIYHICWHPHNFAENIEKNFLQLETLLQCYQKANECYGMQSLNMKEAAEKYQKMKDVL